MSASLSIVTGAQYLGTTAGPAVGALLATFLGFRGTILFAAILPSFAALLVLFEGRDAREDHELVLTAIAILAVVFVEGTTGLAKHGLRWSL